MTLLPPNATPLAITLEDVVSLEGRLAGIEAITGAKPDAITAFLPWLIWEYGLGELMPYLPEPRQAIREGVAWQRLRGTPLALTTALGWRGFAGVSIEETGPGFNFAAFQLDPGAVPTPDAIADLIALARLAAPARARLVRLYHDLDWRAARYDTPLDRRCLYDDWSGVDLDGVRQSFRSRFSYIGADAGDDRDSDGGTVTEWGFWYHADPQRRWDVTLTDGAADTMATVPAVISVQSWHGPDTTAPAPAPHRWTMAKAMVADGVPYDSVDGVYDGYAVLISDGPAPAYDAGRYDMAPAWHWLSADDRQIDALGAVFDPDPPAPSPAPVTVTVIGIHFAAAGRLERYDSLPPIETADRLASDTATGIAFPAADAWGAGPWLHQPWGNTSGAFTMETVQ